MPSFGKASLVKRAELHPDLQVILDEAIEIMDFSIVCGHRGQADQHQAFLEKASKLDWPNSLHNTTPSRAADLCPYKNGLQWKDKEAFYLLGGILKAIAYKRGVRIRLGMDWDMDNDVHDQEFNDLPHIELVK